MPRSKGTSRKGKPKKAERAAGMGRALQKAQLKKFKPKSNGSSLGAGMAASGAQNVGMDNPNQECDNIRSVLETNDLTDFLARAEMADREFASEKEQFVVLDANAQQVVFDSNDTGEGANTAATFEFTELSIPKRPKWDSSTTPEELDTSEKEAFLTWRRSIARHEEALAASSTTHNITSTPFEKNLQVWRQLWRVLERADCVAMVVDGRNPLFYISMDLRRHVEEELGKAVIVVVNKCDYLTVGQRSTWHEYFDRLGLEHVFFSAIREQAVLDSGVGLDIVEEEVVVEETKGDDGDKADTNLPKEEKEKPITSKNATESKTTITLLDPNTIGIENPLTRKQLLQILCDYTHLHPNTAPTPSTNTNTAPAKHPHIEIGMVGFPNVGKSSVLNVLVAASKNDHSSHRLGVASTPGKTKHFQTLPVPDRPDITLCDCPGLVFPSFVSSAADLIVAGVFPLTQVRDFWTSVELVVRRIPRVVLEVFYGIELPRPSSLHAAMSTGGGGVLPQPTAEELLRTFCVARSLLAPSSGVPDHHRAAKVVLTDYVMGRLLFCHAPPPPVGGGCGDNWEVMFQRETMETALTGATKLSDKLAVVAVSNTREGLSDDVGGYDNGNGGESSGHLPDLEDDMDMLDFIGENPSDNQEKRLKGGNRGKKHKTMQKWGKKGRKNRNKDPYGCHVEPDAELLGSFGGDGLCVNAGKYGSSAYTRPDYAGARSAVSFTKSGVAR